MKAKSLFCLLLALLLGLMACTPAADESSATESPDGSEPAVESSAPEESGSEEPFEPAYSTVVSRGKPYTGPHGSRQLSGHIWQRTDRRAVRRGRPRLSRPALVRLRQARSVDLHD